MQVCSVVKHIFLWFRLVMVQFIMIDGTVAWNSTN